MRGLQRSRVFSIKIFARGHVFQFRTGDQLNGARMRRFAREHFLNERIVGAKLGSEIRQGIVQSQYFVVIIDRFGREKLELE